MKRLDFLLLVFAAFLAYCAPAAASITDAAEQLGSDATWIDALDILILSMGSYDWMLYVLLALAVVHLIAIVVVNLTETPEDNTRYGKLYHNVIEPLAGLLITHKAKQKPLSKIDMNGGSKSNDGKK